MIEEQKSRAASKASAVRDKQSSVSSEVVIQEDNEPSMDLNAKSSSAQILIENHHGMDSEA